MDKVNNIKGVKITKISSYESASEEEKIKRNETITFGLLTLYTYINLSDKKQDLNDAIKVAIQKVSENPELTPYLISFSIREILNVSRSALAKCTDILRSGAIDFLNLGNELNLSRGM